MKVITSHFVGIWVLVAMCGTSSAFAETQLSMQLSEKSLGWIQQVRDWAQTQGSNGWNLRQVGSRTLADISVERLNAVLTAYYVAFFRKLHG